MDKPSTQKIILDRASIDRISEWIADSLSAKEIPNEDITRLRLSAEEVLLVWYEKLGDDTECICEQDKKFGRVEIRLKVQGKSVNPVKSTTLSIPVSDHVNLISALGMGCEYSYTEGYNVLKITQPQKRVKIPYMLIAIVSALLLGLLFRLCLPEVGSYIQKFIITPVSDTFLSLISLIAGPLIFLSTLSGIIGIGNFKALGNVGSKILISSLGQNIGCVLFATVIALFSFNISFSTVGTGSALGDLLNLILQIIPKNIVDPFQTGNVLQVVFLAVVIGIGIIVCKGESRELSGSISQLNTTFQIIMNSIGRLMPVLVFVSVFSMVFNETNSLSALIKPAVLFVTMVVSWIILVGIFCKLRFKKPFFELIRNIMPPIIVGITTCSSIAAFQKDMECCKNDFKMDEKVINFALPIGQVSSKVGCTLLFYSLAICLVEKAGITITSDILITIAIISPILGVAVPPVVGGVLSSVAMLFAFTGIPEEYISIVISYLVIADYIVTSGNVAGLLQSLYIGNELLKRDKENSVS